MADGFVIDLTEYKDRVGSRVPEGDYDVVVEDTEDDKSKAGNPMVNVWFRVLNGPNEGATIIDRLVLTEKSLFRVVGFLQALGIPTPRKRFKVPHNAIRGRKMTITVEDGEPYNGRVKSEVRGYSKFAGDASAAEADDLPEDDLPTPAEADEADVEEATSPVGPDDGDDAVEEVADPEVETVSLDDVDL